MNTCNQGKNNIAKGLFTLPRDLNKAVAPKERREAEYSTEKRDVT